MHGLKHFTLSPCTRGKEGRYHPGTLEAVNGGGSRRGGGGNKGGGVKWTCCDVRLPWNLRDELCSGCAPFPPTHDDVGDNKVLD